MKLDGIFSLLQTSMMVNMRTGDAWWDTAVVIAMAVVSSYILANYDEWWDWARNYFYKGSENAAYSIEGKVMLSASECQQIAMFPAEFKAIIYHIHQTNVDIRRGKRIDTIRRWWHNPQRGVNEMFQYVIDSYETIDLGDDLIIRQLTERDSDKESNDKVITYTLSLSSNKRKFSDLKRIVDEWVEEYESFVKEYSNGKQYVFSYTGRDEGGPSFEMVEFDTSRAFTNIFFEEKRQLLERIETFISNPDFYNSKGIPHTLGLLFYGDPGCGKTSAIKAIAHDLGYHIIEINLGRIKTCRELKEVFFADTINDIYIPNSKKLIVLEDIDCMSEVVHDRETHSEVPDEKEVTHTIDPQLKALFLSSTDKGKSGLLMGSGEDDKLTMSFILNLIDGVTEQTGRILIMTTNRPDVLDKALVRPGRIDMKIHFKKCNQDITHEILEFYYENPIPEDWKYPQYVYTPAEIYQFCFEEENVEKCYHRINNQNNIESTARTLSKMHRRLRSEKTRDLIQVVETDDGVSVSMVALDRVNEHLNLVDALVDVLKESEVETVVVNFRGRGTYRKKVKEGETVYALQKEEPKKDDGDEDEAEKDDGFLTFYKTAFRWRGEGVEVLRVEADGTHVVSCTVEKLKPFYRKNMWYMFDRNMVSFAEFTQPDDDGWTVVKNLKKVKSDKLSKLETTLKNNCFGKRDNRRRKPDADDADDSDADAPKAQSAA